MCIQGSVGMGCANGKEDVKIVQVLLNMNGANPPLAADGLYGKNTGTAIESFQSRSGQAQPSGRVDVGGQTIQQLKKGVSRVVGAATLHAIMPHAGDQTIDRFLAPLVHQMAAAGIATPYQQAHFLAQLAHESGEFRYAEELASGEAYEGRADLGNTKPGDGRRFKGRGLIQLTGRANYTSFKTDTGVDVVSDPERVATDADLSVRVACWFWQKKKLNDLAVGDDVAPVTKIVNGGYRGLEERQRYFDRAKFFLVA